MKLIKKLFVLLCIISLGLIANSCSCNDDDDEYDADGKLKISLRNLYFNSWDGTDAYTEYIENKFQVKITPSTYTWNTWDEQVTGPANSTNSNNLTDVFHYSLDSYNFENSYKYWAEGGVIKALPDNLDKWPHLKELINNCTNIDAMKINGKLYCIPLMKNIDEYTTSYSNFTYVYRRDWAKRIGVYQENDEYTWEQFKELLKSFYTDCKDKTGFAALGDVEWGYPSIINFYKQYPHIFALDSNGKVVNNYTTTEYLTGLEIAKQMSSGGEDYDKYYGISQYSLTSGNMRDAYIGNRVGVFYENLSLANYTEIREKMLLTNTSFSVRNNLLDDATAIMKVKGPDGKYALEGTENWFSATFFNGNISDTKMEKILDMIEWTLTDEGTMMATYGFEDYDYTMIDGEVNLSVDGWDVDKNGNYVLKPNGVKCIRYMATLGYDMNDTDPLVNQGAYAVLKAWKTDMDTALLANELRIIKEPDGIDWMYTPSKARYSGDLLEKANDNVQKYCYMKKGYEESSKYVSAFVTNVRTNTVINVWTNTLNEINQKLGK